MIAIRNHTIVHPRLPGYGRGDRMPVWMFHRTRRAVFYHFPSIPMGQYFKAVNTDKQEMICPWCLGGGAKLWEWAANVQGAVFTLLLRQSDQIGGGDYGASRSRRIDLTEDDAAGEARALADVIAHAVSLEGQPARIPDDSIVGRWAGDRVLLVGDYDSSGLYDACRSYRNISEQLVREWNDFIELDDRQLKFQPCSGCSERQDA